ncbi:uncharacterized protein LOC108670699 [Hyalella azteca]|uniref:Uncharacterized protein LOC108670699 n=1 Tax=Hyalella azteca TaxID=294128 RepID=A0A8B7NJ54_HYAAZ|nr:uncharacterized protein LOC108670699 [Hyalella azteca]
MAYESAFLRLPPEVLQCILRHCSWPELVSLSSTCHKLYTAVQDEALWRHLAKTEYHVTELTGRINNTYKKLYQNLLHPYGWMIGLYWSKIDYFGGLLEIKLCGDSIVATSLRITDEGVLEESPCFEVNATSLPPVQLCSMIERPHATHISLSKDGESLRQKCQFHDTKFAQGYYNYNTLDGFRAMTIIDAHRLGIVHQPLSVPPMSSIPRELWNAAPMSNSPPAPNTKQSLDSHGSTNGCGLDASSRVPGGVFQKRVEDHRRASSDPRSNDNYCTGERNLSDDNDAYGSNSNAWPGARPSRAVGRSPYSSMSLGERSGAGLSDSSATPCSSSRQISYSHSQSSSISDDSFLGENFKETTDKIFEGIVPLREQSHQNGAIFGAEASGSTSTLVYNLLAELGRKTDYALNSRVLAAEMDVRENNNGAFGRLGSLHSSHDDLLDESSLNGSPSSRGNTFSKSSTNDSISTASSSSTDSSAMVREKNAAAQFNEAAATQPSSTTGSGAEATASCDAGEASPSVSSLLGASPFYLNSAIGSSRQELAQLYKETHCNPFPAHSASGNLRRSSSSDPWLDSRRRDDSSTRLRAQENVSSPVTAPSQLLPHVLKPGLYCGHYGPHGYEIVMLEYKIKEIVLIKILGDQYVPTREITVKICLPFSFSLTAKEQRTKGCNDLIKIEPESSKLPLSHCQKQPFVLPPFCSPGVETNIPSTCWARYHGFGQLANLFHSQPKFSRVHVVVFSNEEFGVLFLSLKTFMMFRHIKRDFPQRPLTNRLERNVIK